MLHVCWLNPLTGVCIWWQAYLLFLVVCLNIFFFAFWLKYWLFIHTTLCTLHTKLYSLQTLSIFHNVFVSWILPVSTRCQADPQPGPPVKTLPHCTHSTSLHCTAQHWTSQNLASLHCCITSDSSGGVPRVLRKDGNPCVYFCMNLFNYQLISDVWVIPMK